MTMSTAPGFALIASGWRVERALLIDEPGVLDAPGLDDDTGDATGSARASRDDAETEMKLMAQSIAAMAIALRLGARFI